MKQLLVVLWALFATGCVTGADYATQIDSRALKRETSERLETFRDEAEFRQYMRRIDHIQNNEGVFWTRRQDPQQYAQLGTFDWPSHCPDDEAECDTASTQDVVVVTGQMISSNPSITNNQFAGVDEGDIIKQINDYLIVLQDGRLFAVRMAEGEAGELVLTDRVNVYRDADADTWYDEMLVRNDQIIVTGYSYRMKATEVSILYLSEDGLFGDINRFYFTANDYYSGENYASRIVGDKFIIRNEMYLLDLYWDYFEDTRGAPDVKWPSVLKWSDAYIDFDDDDVREHSLELLNVRDVYRPVQQTLDPVLHTLTVCDLDEVQSDDMGCRSTSFIGGTYSEFFVTGEYAYIWSRDDIDEWTRRGSERWDYCIEAEGREADLREMAPSMLHRVKIDGGRLSFAEILGEPRNQFGMTVDGDGIFRAMSLMSSKVCRYSDPEFALVTLPERRFGTEAMNYKATDYRLLPSSGDADMGNRFGDDELVYYENTDHNFVPWEKGERVAPARITVVPFDNRQEISELRAPHSAIRLEVLGNEFVLTGYRDTRGLLVSNMETEGEPSFVSTTRLADQYESEGRSHAFNYLLEEDGSGLLGLPTVTVLEEDLRDYWWSNSSQIAFMERDIEGDLSSIGELGDGEENVHEAYDCEVSCVDWYGNSRPVFTNGRIFALSGTQIVEGAIENGRISEIGRLNLTVPLSDKAGTADIF